MRNVYFCDNKDECIVFFIKSMCSLHVAGKRSVNEDELAEVMAEEAAEGVDKRDPYAFGLGKKVRLLMILVTSLSKWIVVLT